MQLLFFDYNSKWGASINTDAIKYNNLNLAVDFGVKLAGNNRVQSPPKTWRGFLLLGYSPETGFLIAAYATLGDLLSSFIKRRLAMVLSSKAPLFDQVPESLFSASMLMQIFDLDKFSIILLVFVFTIIDLAVTYSLYRWRILKKSS